MSKLFWARVRQDLFFQQSGFTPADAWDWYFLMQHYGMPARLLDCTESPLIALHFALRDAATLAMLKDEAHHIRDTGSPWFKSIKDA